MTTILTLEDLGTTEKDLVAMLAIGVELLSALEEVDGLLEERSRFAG